MSKSFPVILLFSCLLIIGIFFIPMLPVKLNPSRHLPEISVGFSMHGQSARVIEMEVTSKLESMLSRVKGVEGINSYSGNGFGNVTVRLNKHTDPAIARFEVSTVIRQTWPSLPQGVSYPDIRMSQSSEEVQRPFLNFTLNAPSSPVLIQRFAEEYLKPNLAQMEGIDRIDIYGATPVMWKLEYDYVQLRNLGISVDDIAGAIRTYLHKEFLGTGLVETDSDTGHWIRIALVPGNLPEDFEPSLIPVTSKDGKIINLEQLVTVSRQEEEPNGYYRINGLNSIYLALTAKKEANQMQLSTQVRKITGELAHTFPAGYEIHLTYDSSEYLQEEIDKIYFRSGLTVLILLCFVLLIYRNFRYLFLIAFTLTANMSIAAIFYYFFHLEIQLYSLAGITISLTLVIDNTIVMADQIIRRKNKKAFLAILTATVTTIASLGIIFFMDERIRLNLQDFACVLIINLAVSLLIALFLVPALLEHLHIKVKAKQKKRRLLHFRPLQGKRPLVYFNRIYTVLICFLSRWKKSLVVVIILIFGLPVFLLPDKLGDNNNRWSENAETLTQWETMYNETLGSAFYKEKIKPVVDMALGGTLRIFSQKVSEGSYFVNRSETTIDITASLPNGSTLEQMDYLIRKMEDYISLYPEVRQFQTHVQNGRRASITIFFTKEHQKSSFPYLLKSKLITKSLQLGGGSWGVYGMGDGFNNEVKEQAGSYRVKMFGYNYDNLYAYAEAFRDSLLQHRRIKEVTIDSEFSWYKNDYQEFIFRLNKERMIQENISPDWLYRSLGHLYGKNFRIASWLNAGHNDPILLYSKQSQDFDIWSLNNLPDRMNEKEIKLTEVAEIEKELIPQNIARENQQYRLCLQYEYIGSYEQGHKVLQRNMEYFNKILPLGYFTEKETYSGFWGDGKDKNKQYLLLLLIIVIIFFTSGILFNSLKQPFMVICIIPISFIGLFLTFYWFDVKFDQGGFAAFVMLCGLTVNAGIYILNEYNNILSTKKISPMRAYLKAWNYKIAPIFLTVTSTILGFIPFMIGEHKEAFWFPLAVGTIGGLVMSLVGLFIYLPVFMGIAKSKKRKRSKAD